jgi:hypothetical protein
MSNQAFEIIDAWAVHGDGGENRVGPVIGYANSKENADAYAAGKAWYGGDGYVKKVSAMVINGETYILASSRPVTFVGAKEAEVVAQKRRDEELRQQTLASLTPDQRRVLHV